MYIDSRTLKTNEMVKTDLCIIGAGAAGITLALESINKPYRVCLLESGGFKYDAETDGLSEGIMIGRPYDPVASRARQFGGTTSYWGGHCVPIRPLNFEARDWIPYSGWPISRSDLDPYYKRAHKVHQIGEYDYDARKIADRLGLELFPFDGNTVETVVSRYNPINFGEEYRDTIGNASNVTTYLYANVISINQDPDGNSIRDVSVQTLAGNRFSVRAQYFVLATGGIENARLLLVSNAVQKNGLGNEHDLVGRFFMEHLWYESGVILPARQGPLLEIYTSQVEYDTTCRVRCHITLPEPVTRRHRIPDFRSEIGVLRTPPESVVSARILRDNLYDFELPENLGKHLVNIIDDPGAVVDHLTGKKKFRLAYHLWNYLELVPNPDSRIGLSEEKDNLGMNRIALDWRLSGIDKDEIRTAHRLIAAEVGRANFGRMRIELPEEEEILLEGGGGGNHHMGTTRMSDDPKRGVVDVDCRIHGLRNIFIAGSSVFPSCGYSNPTLTIVALAIRLADHLAGLMAKGRSA